MDSTTEQDRGALAPPLTTETPSPCHCEGRVVTCPHCGRPASECDGTGCEHVLETRDWLIPSYRTLATT